MKKLLYILPLILLIISCKDDPVAVEKKEKYTIYGIDNYLVDGTYVGVIGNKSYNHCGTTEIIRMYAYPNPAKSDLMISFTVNSPRNCEVFLEIAKWDYDLLDELAANTNPPVTSLPIVTYFSKESIFKGKVSVGEHLLNISVDNKSKGAYYIIYEDSEGIRTCFPLIVG